MTRRSTAGLVTLAIVAAAGVAALTPHTTETKAAAPAPPLPAEGAVLSPDATFILGLDLVKFTASPLYALMRRNPGNGPVDAWTDLARRAGLVPERDLRSLVAAGDNSAKGNPLVLLFGRFDRRAVE